MLIIDRDLLRKVLHLLNQSFFCRLRGGIAGWVDMRLQFKGWFGRVILAWLRRVTP